MACGLSSEDVSTICARHIYQAWGGRGVIGPNTTWDSDLGLDTQACRVIFAAIVNDIRGHGCNVVSVSPDKFASAKNVGAAIKLVQVGVEAAQSATESLSDESLSESPQFEEFFKTRTMPGGISADYLRGYRDGVSDLSHRITGSSPTLADPILVRQLALAVNAVDEGVKVDEVEEGAH